MKTTIQARSPEQSAFTLIELIVVISIITVLAALTFGGIKHMKENATRKKVKVELGRIETVIESYKAKYGYYPPDNPGKPELNQLYFELMGTEEAGNDFRTLDGRAKIRATPSPGDFPAVFGSGVSGFVNHTHDKSGEGQAAVNFFSRVGLPPAQIGAYKVGNSDICLIVSSVKWPANLGNIIAGQSELNPVRYNSSSPTNNSSSYDLWVDVFIAGKSNRISNWSAQPQFVN